jgi:hypothetical protein
MTVLVVIVGAVYWATRRSPTQSAQKPDGDQIVQRYRVVVAATDLNPYTLLTPDMVQVRESEMPPPPSTFTSPEEVAQRVTRTLIKAGEPIFAHQVTPPLSGGDAGDCFVKWVSQCRSLNQSTSDQPTNRSTLSAKRSDGKPSRFADCRYPR